MEPTPKQPKLTYHLELTPTAQNADPQSNLKRLLKAAGRAYQFRCVRVQEVRPTGSKAGK
jgi:hypothetical protein